MSRRKAYMVVRAYRGEERIAAQHVERAGFASYVPLTLSSDRRRIVTMFGEYFFARWKPQWVAARYQRGVHSVLTGAGGGEPGLVDGAFIDELRSREDRRGVIDLDPPFTYGQSLRVVRGSLTDTVVSFRRMTLDNRVIVLMSLLGRSAEKTLRREDVAAA